MIYPQQISKIGLGTWGVGGHFDANPANDDATQVHAIAYTLQRGVNYVETVLTYAQGRSAFLLAQAIKYSQKKRGDLFITLSIYHHDTYTPKDVCIKVEKFLNLYQSDYLDNLQLTMPLITKLGYQTTHNLIYDLVKQGVIRYTGIVNPNLEGLQRYYAIMKDLLRFQETCYNFEVRLPTVKDGVIWGKQHNIRTICYQPLRRNRTEKRNWLILKELSAKYHKTQNQILLNWLISMGFLPIVKSTTKTHIDENLEACLFQLDANDIQKLNAFRVVNYTYPAVDWSNTKGGITLAELPDLFDKDYDRQQKSFIRIR